MLTITSLVPATCLMAESQTPAQRACCAAMAPHCGEAAMKEGCCAEKTQTRDSLAAVHTSGLSTPAPVVVAILDMPVALSGNTFGSSIASVKPPGPPTYVLVSAFRI